MRATIDTNVIDNDPLLALTQKEGWDVRVISVTNRETEEWSYTGHSSRFESVQEIGVWGESRWGEGTWTGKDSADCFETALKIIGAGSFPSRTKRDHLSAGQRRQLRDAMIFCTHVRDARDLFVTDDRKAFIDGGRREAFESTFGTRILTSAECLSEFGDAVG
jgi:hypothetical protein